MQQLTKHKTYRLLIPLLIFNGFEQGFVYADYNKVIIFNQFNDFEYKEGLPIQWIVPRADSLSCQGYTSQGIYIFTCKSLSCKHMEITFFSKIVTILFSFHWPMQCSPISFIYLKWKSRYSLKRKSKLCTVLVKSFAHLNRIFFSSLPGRER